jgi:hypothetical protein
MRESNAHFGGVLHNGEKIIGTGRKTRLVPRGKGPFDSWEQAAIHALRMKNLHKIKDWSDGRVCFELERYNGWGYQGRGKSKRSPYLWAGTNHQKAGKYVADGKYSSKAWDRQLGAIPVLQKIRELDIKDRDIVRSSRRLSIGRVLRRFLEWTGAAGAMSFPFIQQVAEFATDTRTLFFLLIGAMLWGILKFNEFMSINEFKQGRYVPSGMTESEVI